MSIIKDSVTGISYKNKWWSCYYAWIPLKLAMENAKPRRGHPFASVGFFCSIIRILSRDLSILSFCRAIDISSTISCNCFPQPSVTPSPIKTTVKHHHLQEQPHFSLFKIWLAKEAMPIKIHLSCHTHSTNNRLTKLYDVYILVQCSLEFWKVKVCRSWLLTVVRLLFTTHCELELSGVRVLSCKWKCRCSSYHS